MGNLRHSADDSLFIGNDRICVVDDGRPGEARLLEQAKGCRLLPWLIPGDRKCRERFASRFFSDGRRQAGKAVKELGAVEAHGPNTGA